MASSWSPVCLANMLVGRRRGRRTAKRSRLMHMVGVSPKRWPLLRPSAPLFFALNNLVQHPRIILLPEASSTIIGRAEGAVRRQLNERLPDAFCSVSLLPSLVAKRLVEAADYRLVALPFAKAFSMVSVEEETHDSDRIEELHIQEVTIPTFTYGVSPPIPAEACQTIGTRLLAVFPGRRRGICALVSDSRHARVVERSSDRRVDKISRPRDLRPSGRRNSGPGHGMLTARSSRLPTVTAPPSPLLPPSRPKSS